MGRKRMIRTRGRSSEACSSELKPQLLPSWSRWNMIFESTIIHSLYSPYSTYFRMAVTESNSEAEFLHPLRSPEPVCAACSCRGRRGKTAQHRRSILDRYELDVALLSFGREWAAKKVTGLPQGRTRLKTCVNRDAMHSVAVSLSGLNKQSLMSDTAVSKANTRRIRGAKNTRHRTALVGSHGLVGQRLDA